MSVALVLTRGKMNERLVLGKCCGKLNDRLWVLTATDLLDDVNCAFRQSSACRESR